MRTVLFRQQIDQHRLDVELPGGTALEVLCIRHPRAKRLRLTVSDRGIRLTVPLRTAEATARRFVLEHAGWLQQRMERLAEALDQSCQPFGRDYRATVPLRGAELPVDFIDADHLAVAVNGDNLRVHLPARANDAGLRACLQDFYGLELATDVRRIIDQHAPSLPVQPRHVRFKVMRSLWGSLSGAGNMSIDAALILAPPAALEYVVVHELCHLIEANHSPRFWAEVEKRYADWRHQRDWLRASGDACKHNLGRLLGAAPIL